MWANYFKTAMRLLLRSRMQAAINVLGLALGLSACIVLFLFVEYELSYDSHNANLDRLYRVDFNLAAPGAMGSKSASTPETVGPLLKSEFGEVAEYTTLSSTGELLVEIDGVSLLQADMAEADRQIFSMFTHEILAGSVAMLDQYPKAMAVSANFAVRHFGASNPIGQTVIVNGELYTIGLLFADLPQNTHWRYEALLFPRAPDAEVQPSPSGRLILRGSTYVLFSTAPTDEQLSQIAQAYTETYLTSGLASIGFTAVADIHLYDDATGGRGEGSVVFVLAMAAAAVFILVIAVFNYVNLAIARSIRRTQEVGLRKIVGATRFQLVSQFLSETLLVTLCAFLLAVAIVQLVTSLSPLDQWLNAELSLAGIFDIQLVVIAAGSVLLLTLLTGAYPAFYLSSFAAAPAITGTASDGGTRVRVREVFMLIQLALSIIALTGAALMNVQYRFMTGRDMGFNPDNVIAVPIRDESLAARLESVRNELQQQSSIEEVGIGFRPPGYQAMLLNLRGSEDGTGPREIRFTLNPIGPGYLEVLDIDLLAGEFFDAGASNAQGTPLLVNQSLVRQMGWEDPIGQSMPYLGGSGIVRGVVADFQFGIGEQPVSPLVMPAFGGAMPMMGSAPLRGYLLIRPAPGQMQAALDHLTQVWSQLDGQYPFTYDLLQAHLQETYVSDRNSMLLVSSLALLCIGISMMGLYGLISYMIERQRKAITIRKILGCSVTGILMMFYRNIAVLVALAACVAVPVTLYLFSRWQENYTNQAAIDPVVIVLSVVLTIGVALLTVTGQCLQLARSNPAENLKYQ